MSRKLTCPFATCVVFSSALLGQAGSVNGTGARAAMEASLRRQKASIQQQLRSQKTVGPFLSEPKIGGRIMHVPASNCGSEMSDQEIADGIQTAAKQHGIAPDLLRAVARVESGFQPCAVSPKGALGIMQIMPDTARELGLQNPMDPKESLTAGARYLRMLLDRYAGDLRMALGAYNAGPGRVDRLGDVPRIEETQQYIQRILLELRNSGRE